MADDVRQQRAGGAARRVTSADVARASGVSRATVSYVLNDTPGRTISEATRALVLRTARELGHVPYAPARALRLGRTNTVLALVNDFAIGYVSDQVLRRLDAALAERDYMVLVHRLDHELRSLSDLWSLISPAMVVAMGTFALPPDAVTTFPTSKFLGVYGTVPHARAGGMQAEYLHKRGHTRIGYVYPSAPSLGLVATERLAGFKRACRRLQIGAPLLRRVDADRPETITAALDAWLRPDLGVTAIAAHNDEIAIMTCAAISARGLIPGKDLAVIGVDNIPAARIDLTTVEIDVESWGEAVVAAILAILDDEPPPAIRGEFLRLIERKTA